MTREGRAPPRVSLDTQRLLARRFAVNLKFLRRESKAVRHFSWNDENSAISRLMDGGSEQNPQQRNPDHGIADATPQNATHVREYFYVTELAFSSTIGSVQHHCRPVRCRCGPWILAVRGLALGTTSRRAVAAVFEPFSHRHDVLLVAVPAQLREECVTIPARAPPQRRRPCCGEPRRRMPGATARGHERALRTHSRHRLARGGGV